ncbi:MFS transporter [Actinoplanes sp. NPDC051346]|uniref:MFS transporter n=1 Tax=Actinoplanes sp. NPDC051346 TaxID=3155048 RepID=UPI003433CA2D
MTVRTVSPSPARLSRHGDFRLLWIGQSSSRFGSAITAVALPLVAVGTLDASTMQIALLQAAVWLPWLLIGLPVGVWVDRLPRRSTMITCDVIALLLFVSVPTAAWLHALTIEQLLVVALLAGTTTVFFETAYQVYLPSLLHGARLTEGNAKLQGSEAVAHVAGPGAAGLIAQLLGAVAGLLADALSFLVSAACLLTMNHREPRESSSAPRTAILRDITEGLTFLAHDPYLRVMAAFGAAANLALIGYQAIWITFLVRENGISPGTVGVIVAAMGAGGVIGALIATTVARHLGTARGMLICQTGTAPFALLLPLAGPGARLSLAVVGGIAVSTGVVASNIIKNSFRQIYTPRHLLSRVITSMQLINYGAIPIGALLGGFLGTVLGLRPAIWLMATALVLSTGIQLIGPLRHHRDLPTTPAADPRLALTARE